MQVRHLAGEVARRDDDDRDTAYRTETTATFDPPLAKDMRESKTVIEGKYVGACRDGLQPGDMVTDTGQKLNINQMQPPPRAPKAK